MAGTVAMVALCAAVWVFAVPDTMSLTTFAMLGALAIGATTALLNTWRNNESTDSVGQLINKTGPEK
jgi:hypothetical protein